MAFNFAENVLYYEALEGGQTIAESVVIRGIRLMLKVAFGLMPVVTVMDRGADQTCPADTAD